MTIDETDEEFEIDPSKQPGEPIKPYTPVPLSLELEQIRTILDLAWRDSDIQAVVLIAAGNHLWGLEIPDQTALVGELHWVVSVPWGRGAHEISRKIEFNTLATEAEGYFNWQRRAYRFWKSLQQS
jgi:hypothetical protein